MTVMSKAVVLLSGGLDSATTLAIARSEGFDVYALTFRYGQRHGVEIEAARRVAAALGVAQHVVVQIDLRLFGGSALTADFARIIRLIEDGRIDTRPWITHRPAFEELIDVFPSYTRPETGVIKAIVDVGE